MTKPKWLLRPSFYLVALICLTTSACVYSEAPLSDPLIAEPDPALMGTWMKKDSQETHLLMIGRHWLTADGEKIPSHVPRGIMASREISYATEGRILDNPYLRGDAVFFVSRIGEESYLNVFDPGVIRQVSQSGRWGFPPNTAFWIVKYRVRNDTLELWHMDLDRVKTAIEKGTIKGEIKEKHAVLKDAAGLAAYLAQGDNQQLFPSAASEKYVRCKVVPFE
jgi:hypothetical protein